MFPVSDVIPSRTTPYVTIGIILLNTFAFLFEWQMSDRELQLPVSKLPCRERPDEIVEPVGRDVVAARFQGAPSTPERVLADGVEDDVVRLAVLREVLSRVVDHLVGAERAHELHVLRVAHGSHVRPEVFR